MHEDPKMIEIARDSMILVVAQGHLLQPLTHRRYRLMHPATQLCLNRMQLCHHPLLCRFPPDDEGPLAPTLPTIMGNSGFVVGRRPPSRAACDNFGDARP